MMRYKEAILIAIAVLVVAAAVLGLVMHNRQVAQDTEQVMVYVTKTGECYHRANCRSLRYSKYETTLSDAVADGYRPCRVCKPPIMPNPD